MKLYSFFRSGTSHRLRIALNLKGLTPDYLHVDLRVDEQAEAPFKRINPQGLVPALTLDSGETLIQSPAIIEWLEERYPTPALLPADPEARAHVRALAAIVGCDVHPINNRRILQTLRQQFGADEAAINAWCTTWITAGFDAIEIDVGGHIKTPDKVAAAVKTARDRGLYVSSITQFGNQLDPDAAKRQELRARTRDLAKSCV